MRNFTLDHAWLILGIVFILYSLPNLVVYHAFGSLISVAVGALVVYTSLRNLGGWRRVFKY